MSEFRLDPKRHTDTGAWLQLHIPREGWVNVARLYLNLPGKRNADKAIVAAFRDLLANVEGVNDLPK